MARNLRAKFREWVMLFVLLPATIFMIVSNLFLWRLVSANHTRDLEQEMNVVEASIDQVLRSEATRLMTLAKLPGVEALISIGSRRQAALQEGAKERLEKEWTEAQRTDMLIRGVLDNDIGTLFAVVLGQEQHVRTLQLVDGFGALLAAAEKTPTFYQNRAPWFMMARTKPNVGVVSETLTENSLVGLSLPHVRSSGSDIVDGVLRAEVDLASALKAMDTALGRERREGLSTLLIADRHMVIGGEDIDDAKLEGLQKSMGKGADQSGWAFDLRFHARKLDAGISWEKPLWLIVARPEGRFPVKLYGPMAAGVIGGIAAVFGVYFFAISLGKKLFFDPMEHAAEAGMWVLKRAYGDKMKTTAFTRSHPWADIALNSDEVVARELDAWFVDVQDRIKGNAAMISQAMQQDLELATDFQTALTNRPYPEVPAVHVEGRLRLEFAHQYRPALALGGDFFDIEAISSDCAGVFVADVMGHGTRSAIITSMIRTLLNEFYPEGRNAVHFMTQLNKAFCEMLKLLPSPFFASASYFVADTTSRIGAITLAGHPPPYQLHRSVGRMIRLERPTPRGGAIGVMPGEQFGAETVRLVDGDIFVFYTDGVYEAKNRAGEEFGPARLEKSLQAHIYESPDKLLEKVMADILKFVDDQVIEDDICLVACHVTSQPKKKS